MRRDEVTGLAQELATAVEMRAPTECALASHLDALAKSGLWLVSI